MYRCIKCVFIVVVISLFTSENTFSNIVINQYSIHSEICNHTVVDSILTNSTAYVGELTNNTFIIQNILNEKSYRLSKEIVCVVAFVNSTQNMQQLQFYASRYRYIKVGSLKEIQSNKISISASNNISADKQFLKISVLPFDTLYAVMIMQPISFKDYYTSKNSIYKYINRYQIPELGKRTEVEKIGFCMLMLIMLGIIFILFLFYTLAYFNLKDTIYATYSVYLLVTFFQVLYMAQYTFAKNFVLFNHVGNSLFDEGTKGVMVIIYGIFIIQSLNVTKKYVITYYSLWILIIISALYVLLMLLAYLFKPDFYFEPSYFLLYRIPLFILCIVSTTSALFIPNKTNFQRLILTGSWLYILFAIFSFLQDVNFPYENMWVSIHGLYLGVALELILFSIALAIRVRDTYKESEKLKDVYINELKRNEEFILKENVLLEERVKERVEEIKQQNLIIDEQKRKALIQQFQNEKMEIQMQALSSQMNPHFIFNCMNSIQTAIVKNDNDKASSMLHNFAILIRMVLEKSTESLIILEDEIKLLTTYLNLEKERTNQLFEYEIITAPNVSNDFIKIPVMMLQPFLENSIWHGFKFITYKGLITIHFQIIAQTLCCTITDNGIGRSKAKEYGLRYQSINNKSMAIAIIENKIKLLNQTNEIQSSLEIIDLIDKEENPIGTKVVITLPIL